LFINYHQIIVVLKQLPTARWVHLPAGWHASTHSTQRRTGCWLAIQISPQKTSGLHVWDTMLEAYCKLNTKP